MVLIPLFRSFIFTRERKQVIFELEEESFNPFIQVFYFYTHIHLTN